MFVPGPALSVAVEPAPRRGRGVVALTYRKDLLESPYSPQAMELGLGLFHHIAGQLLDENTGLRSVEIPHQPISPVSRYTDFFEADVKFGCSTAALRVERRILDARFTGADDAIRAMALDHLARNYPDPTTQVAVQLRRALAESLGISRPVLGDFARLLSLHPRTLQRRLAAEGTTFEDQLDAVRRDAAHRLLTTTTLPVGQVASMVGFEEQSSLSHAVIPPFDRTWCTLLDHISAHGAAFGAVQTRRRAANGRMMRATRAPRRKFARSVMGRLHRHAC